MHDVTKVGRQEPTKGQCVCVCVQRTPGFRGEHSEARGKREKVEELMESRQEMAAASPGHQ